MVKTLDLWRQNTAAVVVVVVCSQQSQVVGGPFYQSGKIGKNHRIFFFFHEYIENLQLLVKR